MCCPLELLHPVFQASNGPEMWPVLDSCSVLRSGADYKALGNQISYRSARIESFRDEANVDPDIRFVELLPWSWRRQQ
jgi:hypothetical protein